jgi:hypothetical protein
MLLPPVLLVPIRSLRPDCGCATELLLGSSCPNTIAGGIEGAVAARETAADGFMVTTKSVNP